MGKEIVRGQEVSKAYISFMHCPIRDWTHDHQVNRYTLKKLRQVQWKRKMTFQKWINSE